ncbi:hypothetical protein ASD56_00385 [Microbacterium sp. Root166]|nr:hypothetical protein ASD56_00385 [Microbacterium sp. Root166]
MDAVAPADPPPASGEPGPETEPARPSRTRAVLAWSVGAAAVVAIGVGAGFVHVSANESYDAAASALRAAAAASAETQELLDRTVLTLESSLTSADQLVTAAADDLVDPATRTALADAAAAASDSVAESSELLEEELDQGSADKPFWTWQLRTQTALLEERTSDAAEQTEQLADSKADLESADELMDETALALFASATPAAAAMEAAHVSARTAAVLDFRDAAAAVAEQDQVDADSAVALSVYATRAASLKESAQAELAEKAGRLYATRLEIEAFARSISGGVLLDFDWAPVVNGMGGSSGIGGLATWNSGRGGFSTITLSDSVAEWWPNADSRALVAHEVGHAISAKCHDKFDWENQAANEEWATAWAISMGHTALGNGVEAYGYPSQAMIDIAATCR